MKVKILAVLCAWLALAGVSDAQIGARLSTLPSITTPADADLLYVVKPGDAQPDRKWTIADLKDMIETVSGAAALPTNSAELAASLSDETGSGLAVFATSPSFSTQISTPKVVWTGAVIDVYGIGSPEGAISASIGSVYRRTDGGASTSLYVKESGAGNTGWVPYGNPAGSGAPTTVPFITTVPDGGVSAEFALSTLATGLLKNTTGTGIPTIAVLGTDYLSPASSITNGQLPSTISSKTFDNSNTITITDTNLTIQDNGDATKQGRFNVSAITTGAIRTYDLPNANTRLMADSDFAGSTTGPLRRTGAATYTVVKDNLTATTAPTATDDTNAGYAIGSIWVNTTPSPRDVYLATNVTASAATWRNLGTTTEADTLSTVCARGCTYSAETFNTGLIIQNSGGTVKVSRFVDPTFGPRDQCSPECDVTTFIPTNKVWTIYDQEGAATVLTVDPDAASRNAMYQFGSAYKPVVSVAPPLTERGAVTIALENIVSNQPKTYWGVLTDADTDAFDFEFPITKRMEGATTATVRLIGVSKNATPSGNIGLHCAMQAFRPGTDTFAAHSTTGEQAVTLTPATQNRPVGVTSSNITINGTVAEGGTMFGSCEVSAANTTSAQLTDFRLMARALIQFNANSISD